MSCASHAAEEIKKREGIPLDAKFRIICPRCQKNTLTHKIDNLINQENDKFLFDNIESSELNESSLGQAIHNNDCENPNFLRGSLKKFPTLSVSQISGRSTKHLISKNVEAKPAKIQNAIKNQQKNGNPDSSKAS